MAATWAPEGKHLIEKTDVTLVIDQCHFNVHKHVLETSSEYFRAMFSSGMSENKKDTIAIPLFHAEPFQTIVESFYSGSLDLNESNIFSVVEAAHILQLVPPLFQQCTTHLRLMINPESCFDVVYLCDLINLVEIHTDARRYCLANFSQLRLSQAFLDLTPSQVFNYLSDKSLVVFAEIDVLQAIHGWLKRRKLMGKPVAVDFLKELLAESVCINDGNNNLDTITAIAMQERQPAREDVVDLLGRRESLEDVLLFWSLLDSTPADGLVDVVKLNQETGQGTQWDSMTDVVASPGYDLGSAVCSNECSIYLCGGGPSFGKLNWIRKIYKFDICKSQSRWQAVGDLYETRRHHAMVAMGTKLYIFGGFGKFRAKNVKLDCFDTTDGTWESLPVTPTHEIKPVATCTHDSVIYLDRSYELCIYNTLSQCWSTFRCPIWRSTPPLSVLTTIHPPPVAILRQREEPDKLFLIVEGEYCLSVVTLRLDSNTGARQLDWTDIEPTGKYRYRKSVLANGKLVVLLGCTEEDVEMDTSEGDVPTRSPPVRRVLTYCMKRKKVVSVCDTNVQFALNVVAVPRLPAAFSTGSGHQFELEDS